MPWNRAGARPRRRTIEHWEPNDATFWAAIGQRVARRNLSFSILAEFIGFSVWLVWSVVAVNLNKAGFDLSTDQLFWLVSLPALVGATMRLPYGAAVPLIGGRNFTVFSAAVLLVPTVGLAVLVQDPTTPYWLLLLCAGTAGLGGGNFASSMANISHFYPEHRKGWALGLNAAGGNIGVSFVQVAVPAAIGLGVLGLGGSGGGALSLEWAGLLFVPLIVVAVVCALLFMDNLTVARAGLREQAAILRRGHTWVMSFLYIGTFGSFIGYSAAFPLLISLEFPDVQPLRYAFLGALVGSISRPLGGWLSDRVGGGPVTIGSFVAMAIAVGGVLMSLSAGSFVGFFGCFMALFVASGAGNGSTYRIIPTVFLRDRLAEVEGHGPEATARAQRQGRTEAAAAIAFSSAIGAYGGFLIPQGFSRSISASGGPETALAIFAAFYVICLVVTWWFYLRSPASRKSRVAVVLDRLASTTVSRSR